MKKQLLMCSECKEETWHMVGKKQATNKSSAYMRRSTCECTQCGKKEINNKTKGKRIFSRRNTPNVQKASEVKE